MKTTEKLIETVERYVDHLYAQRQIPNWVVEVFDEERNQEHIYRYDFTDEEIAQIMSLKKEYGTPGFAKYLVNVFKDEDVVYDIAMGCDIVDIRYEDTQQERDNYPIRFTRYEYDGELNQYPFSIWMPKRYYARLLRHHIENPDLTFNMLEKIDPGLSEWLRREVWEGIDKKGHEGPVPPFLILMDQAKTDALKLIKTLNT